MILLLQKVYLQRLMPVYVGLTMVSCLFLSVPPIICGVLLNRAEFKAACRLYLIILNRRNIGIIRRNSAQFLHSLENLVLSLRCAKWYLLMSKSQSDRKQQFSRCSDIGQSSATIGLHKIDAASDWFLIKRHCIGKKGLPGVQVQN